MVVVFVDPYCKRFKLFTPESPDHTNGHHVCLEGGLHEFIAEITLTDLATVKSLTEFEILHPDQILSPDVVLAALQHLAKNYLRPESTKMDVQEKSVLVSVLFALEQKYRTGLSQLVSVVEACSFQLQFKQLIDEIHALNQQLVWRCIVRKGDGVQHLLIEGIGSGKHLHWPSTVGLCGDHKCKVNDIRQQLLSVNLLFTQIQWVIKQLSYTDIWSDKPTKSKWFVNYHFDRNHRYSKPWFFRDQSSGIRPLISRPMKTLLLWSEFIPDSNDEQRIHQTQLTSP